MHISCKQCSADYDFDAAAIPAGGYQAACSHCQAVFWVSPPTPPPTDVTASCPNCTAVYQFSPQAIPAGGYEAQCTQCAHVFFVAAPASQAAPTPQVALASQTGFAPQALDAGTMGIAPLNSPNVPTAPATPLNSPSVPTAPATPQLPFAAEPDHVRQALSQQPTDAAPAPSAAVDISAPNFPPAVALPLAAPDHSLEAAWEPPEEDPQTLVATQPVDPHPVVAAPMTPPPSESTSELLRAVWLPWWRRTGFVMAGVAVLGAALLLSWWQPPLLHAALGQVMATLAPLLRALRLHV